MSKRKKKKGKRRTPKWVRGGAGRRPSLHRVAATRGPAAAGTPLARETTRPPGRRSAPPLPSAAEFADQAGRTASGPAGAIMEILHNAGFRLDSERNVTMGMLVYNSAVLLMGHMDEIAPKGRPVFAGNRWPDPAWLPNVTSVDEAKRDLDRLTALFRQDPDLRKVRLSPHRTATFLAEALKNAPPDPTDDFIDELGTRYFQEVEGAELVEQLPEKLAAAATRMHDDPGRMRSLVLGMFLAAMSETGPDDLDLLAAMLFRLTISEEMDDLHEMKGIVGQLVDPDDPGDLEELEKKFHEGDAELMEKVRRLTDEMDPEQAESMRKVFDQQLDRVAAIIRARRFPVDLPFASVLPFMVRLAAAAEGKPSDKQLGDMVVECLDELGPEDFRLFGEFLDAWVRSDDHSDNETREAVLVVRTLAAGGRLQPLDWPLLLATAQRGRMSLMEGEGKVVPMTPEGNLLVDRIGRYADFLEKRGYPVLAERTRLLALHKTP